MTNVYTGRTSAYCQPPLHIAYARYLRPCTGQLARRGTKPSYLALYCGNPVTLPSRNPAYMVSTTIHYTTERSTHECVSSSGGTLNTECHHIRLKQQKVLTDARLVRQRIFDSTLRPYFFLLLQGREHKPLRLLELPKKDVEYCGFSCLAFWVSSVYEAQSVT